MLSETVQSWLDNLDEVIQEGRVSQEDVIKSVAEAQFLGEDIF